MRKTKPLYEIRSCFSRRGVFAQNRGLLSGLAELQMEECAVSDTIILPGVPGLRCLKNEVFAMEGNQIAFCKVVRSVPDC